MDKHPDIDGSVKFVSPKLGQQHSVTDVYTKNKFLERYHLSWVIDESTTVIGHKGNSFRGMHEIINNLEKLPKELRLLNVKSSVKLMLTIIDNSFFGKYVYKYV